MELWTYFLHKCFISRFKGNWILFNLYEIWEFFSLLKEVELQHVVATADDFEDLSKIQ